ncbi:hypothetical protein Bca4012_069051 [Brassica carinata]
MKNAERIEREGKGKGCLVVVNKMGYNTKQKPTDRSTLRGSSVPANGHLLFLYSTTITGHSVDKYVPLPLQFCFNLIRFDVIYERHYTCSIVVAAATVQKERSRRLSTAILNQVIRELAVAFKSPPRTRVGKREAVFIILHICSQQIRPPTFVFFVNDAKLFSNTYRRYLEKHCTDAGSAGTPIPLLWLSRKKI